MMLLAALCFVARVHAQVTPLGDTYTNSADPTTNYGAQKTLDVDAAKEITYIEFNLASVPAGASISQATLKLYVNTVVTAGAFELYAVNGTWTESALTYDLAPALGSVIDASVPITTADKNQYILIPMTSTVQGWLNTPATNNGIALVAIGTFNATFDSKETATTSHPPELDIVFAGGGGSGITGIDTAAGSGLIGGGTSGTLNLSLTNTCAANQVLEWNGTGWACASVGTGTITGVTAGTDLTGGGTSGNVTLNLNTANVPLLAAANTFTGNQTVSGNLSATGVVSGSAYQIGSSLFAYGSTSTDNAFLGFAGNATITGTANTGTGYGALAKATSGGANTASGFGALAFDTTGQNNTAIGLSALYRTTTGNLNSAIGVDSGVTADNSSLTGSNNTALGTAAAFGTGSLNNATAVGAYTLVGESNALVLGSIKGLAGATSNVNVGIGTSTPDFPLDVVGTINSSTGFSLGEIGFAFGTYGNQNAFVGFAGNTAMTGGGNTADGALALFNNAAGTNNTAVGANALPGNTDGNNNSAIGFNAGSTPNGVLTGSNDTFLGANAVTNSASLTNSTAIGANVEVESNNAIVLGSIKGLNGATSSVGVGIGTSAPAATLDVHDNGLGGNTISATTSALNNAVYGVNTATSGSGANGGYFTTSSPQGSGIVAQNFGTGGSDYAAYLVGNVFISGNVSKGGGSFKIDHPLDPANKYLYHSFVESPDMMNIYNGVAALDAHGSVWITLPDYFEALNQDFRYQLTSMGRPQPSLYVAKEISGNRFKISGGKPGGKVSWQVTGIRHDAYADAHRIRVEEEKPPQEQGRYLHPELFGAPAEQAIGYPAPPVTRQPEMQAEGGH
jgi:hypothetical protein